MHTFCEELQLRLSNARAGVVVCPVRSGRDTTATRVALAAYRNAAHTAPVVLVLSTAANSAVIAGLDLHMPQLAIVCG